MFVVNLDPDGTPPWEILRQYGKQYGFLERLKMGGVGSPKIVYQSGVTEFDDLVEAPGSDTPYLNFEYLKKTYRAPGGLLGRLNKGQQLKGILLTFDEVEKIVLKGTPVNTVTKKRPAGLLEGQLHIYSNTGAVLRADVTVQAYVGLQKYFEKQQEWGERFIVEKNETDFVGGI